MHLGLGNQWWLCSTQVWEGNIASKAQNGLETQETGSKWRGRQGSGLRCVNRGPGVYCVDSGEAVEEFSVEQQCVVSVFQKALSHSRVGREEFRAVTQVRSDGQAGQLWDRRRWTREREGVESAGRGG